MGMIGNFFRTDGETVQKLQKGEVSLYDLIDYESGKVDEDFVIDIDKSWHAMHYTLCGEVWESTDDPLSKIVLNGSLLNDEDVGYGPAMIITAPEVHNICDALKTVSKEWLRARFSVPEMAAKEIYPIIDDEDENDFFDYVYSYFEEVVLFFDRAKIDNHHILFFVN